MTNESPLNVFTAVLTPLAVAAIVWALTGITAESLDAGVVTLTLLTIFCSCYLRIQLPRAKIHLTISDGLIILSMLLYGGEVALLLAVIETTFASLNILRQGLPIKPKTILLNTYFAALAVFVAAQTILITFGPPELVLRKSDFTGFVLVLTIMSLSLFFVNSTLVAIYTALKRETSIAKVWTENLFNAVVIYMTGAVVAGLIVKALEQVNIFLFAAVFGFFGVIYLTFRGFVEDVKTTVEKAKRAERERAEQAEGHVTELQHYVFELERSGEALVESREKFRHAAYHDALTGLPNRNYIVEQLRDLLDQQGSVTERRFAVLFLNLNRFRAINDSLGHATGDRIVREVAKRLSQMAGLGDVVGHFGGDEFTLILKDIDETDVVTRFAEKIARRLAESIRFNGREVYTSVSIGIAFGNAEYKHAEDILRDADIAMYNAKDNGINSTVFDSTMRDRAIFMQQVETDLRYAIVCNELELFYQPLVRLSDATLCGFEALVRWNHPKRGLVSPLEFIPVAEATGLIIPMTNQILRSACAQFVEWEKRYDRYASMMLSVNISVMHFADSGLVDQIERTIAETGIRPSSLKLEITESAVMDNAEQAISTLRRIKETGVAISIDDFGTGYSSLSYLHRFPIDYLKIDRSFVISMDEGTENREIVRTIIGLANALKLSVIAEGIETLEQFERIRNLGCEFGQGYLFSRPLPVEQIDEMLGDKEPWIASIHARPSFSGDVTSIGLVQ